MEFSFNREVIRSTSAADWLREDEDPAPSPVAEPVQEPGALVEASGGSVVREDGTVKCVIIRPCISRGKAVRGLQPIYTPQMLAENHKVFEGWVMFADHLVEQVQESLPEAIREARRTRGIRELGGRIVRTEWDPSFTHPDDGKYGHLPGAVIGYALPQPFIREMLEADPEILRLSINAYPSGVREGSYNGRKGALIEGISPVPEGSVDWVIRAGAGGRVLVEDEQLAVSVLEGFYDSPAPSPVPNKDEEMNVENMTNEELLALVRKRPELMEALTESAPAPGLSEDAVASLLAEYEQRLTDRVSAALAERDAEFEARVEALVEDRSAENAARGDLAAYAHQLIESAEGLTDGWKVELKSRYSILPSGPTAYLLVEDDEEGTARDKVRALVEDDVEHALELIREARPAAAVTGQGGGNPDEGGETKAKVRADNPFVAWMMETDKNFKSPDDVVNALREAVN